MPWPSAAAFLGCFFKIGVSLNRSNAHAAFCRYSARPGILARVKGVFVFWLDVDVSSVLDTEFVLDS